MNNNIFQCETIFWKFLNLYLCFLVFMACGHIHTLYTSPSHHLVGDVCGPQAWVLRSGSLRVLCSILAVTRSVLFWTETSGVLGICVHMWGIQVVLRLLCLVSWSPGDALTHWCYFQSYYEVCSCIDYTFCLLQYLRGASMLWRGRWLPGRQQCCTLVGLLHAYHLLHWGGCVHVFYNIHV